MTAYIRFYRDQSHLPRIQVDPEHAALADYLESDLQDTATVAEVLAILQKPADGRQEINGNSYTVTLSPDQVILESLFDDEQELYSLQLPEFQHLLTAWTSFLDNDNLMSIRCRIPDISHS